MMDAPKRIFAWSAFPTSHLVGTWAVTRYPNNAEHYILAAEHDRLTAERDRLIGALRAVEADCLDRAKFSRDGKTVPIGDGAWRGLCNVLAEIEKEAGE